jgi:hypothetical protein
MMLDFKPGLILIIVIGIVLLSSSLFAAPPEEQEITLEGDVSSYFLPELGAAILFQDQKLSVVFITPPEQRPEGYGDVDLQQGDIILMANGKKMASTDDIQKMHDAVEIGEIIKFGIKRDKSMMMISFEKADPKDLPQVQMMISTQDDDDDPLGESDGKVIKSKTMSGLGDIVMMDEVGLLFMQDGNQTVLNSITHELAENLTGVKPAPDDVLKSIQGKTFTSLKECRAIYEKIPIGEKVELVFTHGGKEASASFEKQKARRMKMIHKSN